MVRFGVGVECASSRLGGSVSSKRATTATIGAMSPPTALPWRLVVPVKGGAGAKSRLHPPPGVDREDLALALATDCLTACCAGMPPTHVLVVTSDPRAAAAAEGLGAVVVADPGAGLNAAVAAGRDHALRSSPGTPVAVLLGDLPALRPVDLVTALGAAAAHPMALVPDAAGEGSTLLTAVDGTRLAPLFGTGSATAHEATGHVRLDLDLPRLRTDVDDDAALRTALALGVGPATLAVLAGTR